MTNSKTTISAVIGLAIVIGTAVQALIDGNPATNPDWGAVGGAIMACIGLIFAKDSNVTGGTVAATPEAAARIAAVPK
jgi:hypothetical protein